MFDTLEVAPPDPIMGLTEAFKNDPNPDKINLTIGVYQDKTGTTPIFSAVKVAETRLIGKEQTKSYLSIDGSADYAAIVQDLVFGPGHEIILGSRAVTAHTPGGTGALRVAAEFLAGVKPGAKVWLSQPTWPNHAGIFEAAGLELKTYPYYDTESKSLDFAAMTDALARAGEGDIVVLHGCCHNPTGLDPDIEQWRALAELTKERGVLPFFDFAYQGLGEGLEADAAGLRTFCNDGRELLIATSYSKNFGLYRERTGGLMIVARSDHAAEAARSHLKRTIRCLYSNPPAHGALIVTEIMTDTALRQSWETELRAMCARIQEMRTLFVKTLQEKGVQQDFSFVERQRGMFSYSGLNPEQVEALRASYAIYIVGSGRINIASMNETNMNSLCSGIAAVL